MGKYEPEIDFIQHDYRDNDWLGVVVNIKDPTFSGRCQVKVFGLFDGILDDHLPWAAPINSTIFASDGAGSLSVPKVGQIVRIQFNNGDLYAPEYTTIQNIDTQLIQKIKDDYEGTHVLLYDTNEELTIIYQKNSGIQIYHKESFIAISPDSLITIQTPDADSLIQLDGDITHITTKNEIDISAASKVTVIADEVVVNGAQATKVGPGPYQKAVGGETLMSLLKVICSMIDSKLPATPGVATGLCESTKQSILSTNVYISI